MIIEIEGPAFKCADDRKIFVSRLAEIPGYESVLGSGSMLRLTTAGSPEELVANELQKICDVWNTSFIVVEHD